MRVRTALSVLFNDAFDYCDYITSVNDQKRAWILAEWYWWRKNVTTRRKKLSYCHFVHHKSHMACHGMKPDFLYEIMGINRQKHKNSLCMELLAQTHS
jgi:hypothetical protein